MAAEHVDAAGLPRSELVGETTSHLATAGDSLPELARRFDVGFIELMAANAGKSVWMPEVGSTVVIPTQHLLPIADRRGIVINLAEMRLYLFGSDGGLVATYPVGIGVEGASTPTGRTSVIRKRRDPSWAPPASIRAQRPELPSVIPPGPDNPLGAFALDLGWPSYLIHGTNRPFGIGRRVSQGCVRLYPEDIARLFEQVAVGTPVQVIDQPVKLAWVGERLFLEIHPSIRQQAELDATGTFTPETSRDLAALVRAAAGGADARIDWLAVRIADLRRSGLPVPIAAAEAGL